MHVLSSKVVKRVLNKDGEHLRAFGEWIKRAVYHRSR